MGAIGRRTFMAALGGTAMGAAVLPGLALGAAAPQGDGARPKPLVTKKPLIVQPALVYHVPVRQEKTSWRGWGGLHTQADADAEINRIGEELAAMAKDLEFPLEIRPVAHARHPGEADTLRAGDHDLMLIYGASGGGDTIEHLIDPAKFNLMFVRHKSGPVYLWYEIVSPRMMRKTVDELGQPGLLPEDVVVDEYADIAWRMRALYALKNTVGSKIVCVGGASGWGDGGQKAPAIAAETWKMQLIDQSYDDLGPRIVAARQDAARVARAEAAAKAYLADAGITLETDGGYVTRAFILAEVFEEIMAENEAQAITVNNCMGTIMPLADTTACLTLTLINDAGLLAFCESDFVVIPSGILLHHIASLPVFLNDPTYPHHGQITLAHCTAPRRMDSKTLEPARILTHFESDFGAAPKVAMKLGQKVTVLDPDFNNAKWIGFTGDILDNPFLDICRSQVDVSIEGDCDLLAREMKGFHWMLAYGDHLKETGYALSKLGVDFLNLSKGAQGTVSA
jgi:hypothetical protein